ncbi:hypothetical protein PoB_006087300 [Plakobranchus ocellatus]|uniref:Uncharacterized protein n=1 Tax=Plakobranchus ocellatus TaxID=259542 RepID=A0AAV4CR82_9GAST|nr:hypothetical protein PoB_006087300 [Plakobranchus ocellatus]
MDLDTGDRDASGDVIVSPAKKNTWWCESSYYFDCLCYTGLISFVCVRHFAWHLVSGHHGPHLERHWGRVQPRDKEIPRFIEEKITTHLRHPDIIFLILSHLAFR